MIADKASPCPWSINGVSLGGWRIDSPASGRVGNEFLAKPVALVPDGADAALIVRAVNNFDDLLAALKRMVDICGWDEPETYHDEQDLPRADDPHRESVAKARAAIAKAEGREP